MAEQVQREWLSLRELTRYASVSERTLRGWIREGSLPAFKVRGKVFVRRSVFDAWLERHPVAPDVPVDLGVIVDEVVEGCAGGR